MRYLNARLATTFGLYILFGFFELLSSIYAAKQWSPEVDGIILFDIGFKFVPEKPHDGMWGILPNLGQFSLLIITLWMLAYQRHKDYLPLRRFVMVSIWMTLARTISISATVLPDPYQGCQSYRVDPDDHVAVALVQKILLFLQGKSEVDCFDVFFSGHAAFLGLCAMAWSRYIASADNWGMKLIIWVWMFVNGYWMIVVRFHYTNDIFFGYYMSISLWIIYHMVVDQQLHRYSYYWSWFEMATPISASSHVQDVAELEEDIQHDQLVNHSSSTQSAVLVTIDVVEDPDPDRHINKDGRPLDPQDFKHFYIESAVVGLVGLVSITIVLSSLGAVAMRTFDLVAQHFSQQQE